MTAFALSAVERPVVQRALTTSAEILEVEATDRLRRRGHDRFVDEEREEAALLRAVLERLAGDQSPVSSRASAGAGERSFELAWSGLPEEEIRRLIHEGEAELDARFLEQARTGRREVSRLYTGTRR